MVNFTNIHSKLELSVPVQLLLWAFTLFWDLYWGILSSCGISARLKSEVVEERGRPHWHNLVLKGVELFFFFFFFFLIELFGVR